MRRVLRFIAAALAAALIMPCCFADAKHDNLPVSEMPWEFFTVGFLPGKDPESIDQHLLLYSVHIPTAWGQTFLEFDPEIPVGDIGFTSSNSGIAYLTGIGALRIYAKSWAPQLLPFPMAVKLRGFLSRLGILLRKNAPQYIVPVQKSSYQLTFSEYLHNPHGRFIASPVGVVSRNAT